MAIFKALAPALTEPFTLRAVGKNQWHIHQSDETRSFAGELTHVADEEYTLTAQGEIHPIFIHQQVDRFQVHYRGQYYVLQRVFGTAAEALDSGDQVIAPLTGKVIQVNVSVGDKVAQGETLVVLESMKMETALVAPRDAVIESLHCHTGDQVANEQVLVRFETEETDP